MTNFLQWMTVASFFCDSTFSEGLSVISLNRDGEAVQVDITAEKMILLYFMSAFACSLDGIL